VTSCSSGMIFIPLIVTRVSYDSFKITCFRMAEELRGPFEKFVDWQQCTAVMLLCRERHNPPLTHTHTHKFFIDF
jgi:hypothetical protein